MTAQMADINSRTPAGVLAYCEYLIGKGYASAAQVNPWRTAVQKVFEVVEGDGWETVDLTTADLDDYLSRFRTLVGAQYKAESITAYGRRMRNAIDAHEHYLAEGRPPAFRQGGKREKPVKPEGSLVKLPSKDATTPRPATTSDEGLIDYRFVLRDGRVVTLPLPPRLHSDDVNRLSGFLRTLQDDGHEQRQLPAGSARGSEVAA